MIYTIERRHEFDYGTMETHYEVRQCTHRTHIGVLAGGKTLRKFKKKTDAQKYCAKKGIKVEETMK